MEPATTADGQLVLVSARLLDAEDRDPGFVAFDPDDAGRPVGDGRTATGWELYAGDESDAELEDASRVRLADLGWALERYPTWRSLVERHDGAAGAWLAEGTGWVELDDEDVDG